MAAKLTYNAVTPTGYFPTIDQVAVKAQTLAGYLNEMEGVRSAYPINDDATYLNNQLRQIAGLFQALVDEITEDAERHGLKPDPDGEWITCAGFEIQEMRVA